MKKILMMLVAAALFGCGSGSEQTSGDAASSDSNTAAETNDNNDNGAVRTATASLVMPQDLAEVPKMLRGRWEQTASHCDSLGQNCDTLMYGDMTFTKKGVMLGGQFTDYYISNDTFYLGPKSTPVHVMHLTPSDLICNWLADTNIMRYERMTRMENPPAAQ